MRLVEVEKLLAERDPRSTKLAAQALRLGVLAGDCAAPKTTEYEQVLVSSMSLQKSDELG